MHSTNSIGIVAWLYAGDGFDLPHEFALIETL